MYFPEEKQYQLLSFGRESMYLLDIKFLLLSSPPPPTWMNFLVISVSLSSGYLVCLVEFSSFCLFWIWGNALPVVRFTMFVENSLYKIFDRRTENYMHAICNVPILVLRTKWGRNGNDIRMGIIVIVLFGRPVVRREEAIERIFRLRTRHHNWRYR